MTTTDSVWSSFLRWVLAALVTLPFLVFQRRTGPTYPVRGVAEVAGMSVAYRLPRSATVGAEALVRIPAPDSTITGTLVYRRFRSPDPWTAQPLQREGGLLLGRLPELPPAGKVMYLVRLRAGEQELQLTEKPVVLRYKGRVPLAVLLPHVLFITMAMLLSNRTGLEAMTRSGKPRLFMGATILLFIVGGLVLGPIVQKMAFGAYWTGFPFGHDLTDNKTLVALLGWIGAWVASRGGRQRRGWVIAAAVVMIAVYLIPHSLLGSELDFSANGR